MKPSFSYPTHYGRTNPATRPGKHPARRYCLPAVLLTLVMMICAAGPATTFAQSVIYVNDDAAGATKNGSSWATAYTSLQDALGAAGSGDQIWVAGGVYTPVTPADPDNVTEGEREATFQLVDGVEIYGGFGLNDEDELIGRNVETNLTILSGDIDGNDDTFDPEMNSDGDPDTPTQTDHIVGDNSYHVVTAGDGITLTTRLDGFTITGGSADPGDGTINNHGGGMINFGDPTLPTLPSPAIGLTSAAGCPTNTALPP